VAIGGAAAVCAVLLLAVSSKIGKARPAAVLADHPDEMHGLAVAEMHGMAHPAAWRDVDEPAAATTAAPAALRPAQRLRPAVAATAASPPPQQPTFGYGGFQQSADDSISFANDDV